MTKNKKNNDTKVKNIKETRKVTEAKEKKVPKEVTGLMRAVPAILIAIALFLTLCFITADTGAFGKFISGVLMGLFSYMAYTIPIFVALHAVFYFADVKEGKLVRRIIFSLVALITLSMIAFLIPAIKSTPEFDVAAFYKNGTESKGGGFVGSVIAYALMKIFGKVGLIIIILLLITVYVIYLASGGGSELSKFFLKKLGKLANFGASLEEKSQSKKKKREEERLAKQRAFDDKRNADFYNDEYFGADNGVSTLEIPELGILETKNSVGSAHILRETVIKNTDSEVSSGVFEFGEENEPQKRKNHFADVDINSEPRFVRTEAVEEKFGSDDIVYEALDVDEPTLEAEDEAEEAFAPIDDKTAADYGIDDSADAIFTADFDPFDIALNEKRAEKASSRIAELKRENNSFSEYIADMTPEQIEQKRRIEEFEENRRRALERQAAKKAEEAAVKEAIEKENLRVAEERAEEARIEKARAAAEAARREEQARLASFAAGYSEPKPAETSNGADSGAHREKSYYDSFASQNSKATVLSITNDYENQYGSAIKNQNAADKYRFVGGTVTTPAEEPRRAYNSDVLVTEKKEEPKPEVSYATQGSSFGSAAYSSFEPVRNEVTVNIQSETEPRESNAWVKVENPSEIKPSESALSFENDDDYTEQSLPSSADAKEFTFTDTESVDIGENAEDEDMQDTVTEHTVIEEVQTLEVSRSMISPTLEIEEEEEVRGGLDFSLDDDDEDEDFTDSDAEETVERIEIPPEERNPDVEKYRSMFTVFDDESDDTPEPSMTDNYTEADSPTDNYDSGDAPLDNTFENTADEKFEDDEDNEASAVDEYLNDEDDVPFEAPVRVAPPKKEEKPKAVKPDYSNYKFPPIDLLKKSPEEDWDKINEEIQYCGEQLLNTLDSFNIKATMRGMEHGPRITRYSIVPAKGVRTKQIENLADDIALALAAESIRIEAPIPGKSAVGVEVPNKVPSLVTLRDLLEAPEFMEQTSKTCVCIGKSVEGSLVYGDIGSMPHVLIAGATGMGKSVCINSLITSMLYKARPDEIKFIMIDPKKVEFAPYKGIPHLLVPVVTEPKQAAGALMWAVDEMNKRYDIIEQLCVKSIDSYNKKVSDNPELGAPMPKIVIFIDELNDLMVQVRDPVEDLIMLIAQKARAAGIHLVIGTQRPSVDVITGVIKANIPTRIACKVASGIDSRTILEKTGAEKLIGKGDMLFAIPGKEPKRVQGAFVSESETESIVEFIKAQVKGELYDESAMEEMKRAAQKCDKNKNDDSMDDDDDGGFGGGYLHDRKFLNAVELAIRNGSVATSFLQRKLHIGYGKAAQYIDIMEDLGVVGEKNGSKARDVLIRMDEWNEKLARLTDDSY